MVASSIKSAERALALFEYFALHQEPATISEIGRDLSMPQSSTSMLVRNLVELGYLEHNAEARTYMPTMRIALLGSWINKRLEKAAPLPKFLNAIANEIQETTVLAIRNGVYAQYILVQLPHDPLRLHVESGMMRPLHLCAPGRVFLAKRPNAEVSRILRRINTEVVNERQKMKNKDLLTIVAETRQRGYAETKGDMTEGAGAFAVEIPPLLGSSEFAVSVGGPIKRVQAKKKEILRALHDFRSQISAQDLQEIVKEARKKRPATPITTRA